jgi:hypothetical protein
MSTYSYDGYLVSPGASDLYTIASEVPLVRIPSKIHDCIVQHLTLQTSPSKVTHNCKMIALKTILSLGGILGRVPLIPLSSEFHKEIPGLGIVFAASNFVAFSSYLVWSSIKMIDQMSLTMAISEHVQTKSYERCRKITSLAFSVINGIFAQVPYFFLSWQYNAHKPYMITFNALDIVPPIYSLNLILTRQFTAQAYSVNEKKILDFKKYLLDKINEKLIALRDGDGRSVIQTFIDIESISDPSDRVISFFDSMTSEYTVRVIEENPCVLDFKYASAKLIGLLLMSVQLFWAAFLSYKGTSLVTTNTTLIGLVSLYVVVCNIALTRFVLIKSTYQLINATQKLCVKDRSYNYLCERLFPKTSAVARIISLCLVMTAFIPALTLSNDFIPEAFVLPSTVLYGIGFALMNYLPVRDLLDVACRLVVKRLGNADDRTCLRTYEQVESVKRIIENSSAESLAIFLLKTEGYPGISLAMHRFDLNIESLQSFIHDDEKNTRLHAIPSQEYLFG